LFLIFAVCTLPVTARAGSNEVALILDNSCSMVTGGVIQGTREKLPPNDPERAAVLGALLVEGLVRGSEDQLTVIAFGDRKGAPPRTATTGDTIRALEYGGGTWFEPALLEAARVLGPSARGRKLLLLFTDGAPTDLDRPKQVIEALNGTPSDFQSIGLYASEGSRKLGEPYLSAIVRSPDDLVLIDALAPDTVQRVVRAFTQGYARVLGSKPVTGTLQPGGSVPFEVGRYVTEVLVTTAQIRPGAPFEPTLTGPGGAIPTRAMGDNGCPQRVAPGGAETVCDPPRRHYATFRANNDPYAASTWTLTLPNADGPVEYGVILRYDLTAQLDLPPQARVGEPVPIEGKLLFRGQVFTDEAFFAADGFAAALEIGGATIPLQHAGGGRFTGVWTPASDGAFEGALRFTNQWMSTEARKPSTVEGFLDLVLRVSPNPVELGAWQGARGASRRCQELDLTGSLNADRVPLACDVQGQAADATLSCGPVAGSEATVDGRTGQPMRWEVCVTAKGCCGDQPAAADAPFLVTLRGAHPHYASGAVAVPVRWEVRATGFLRCWWPVLAAIGAALVGAWLVYGWISPHNFDPTASVRIAGNPTALRRASALVLAEQPGGRRGFYRSARFALLHDGTPVRNVRGAILVLEAGRGGSSRFKHAPGLERLDRRTEKWVLMNPEDLAQGFEPNTTYRIGSVHLRFG
jgi:hypothetical protein